LWKKHEEFLSPRFFAPRSKYCKRLLYSTGMLFKRNVYNHIPTDMKKKPDPPKKEPPVKPEKDIPVKPDPNPDPTEQPERNDPTRIDEPEKNDPTRITPPKTKK
jgi:hypothetical protein